MINHIVLCFIVTIKLCQIASEELKLATSDCLTEHNELSSTINFLTNCKKENIFGPDVDSNNVSKHNCFMMRWYCARKCTSNDTCSVQMISPLNTQVDEAGQPKSVDCVCIYQDYSTGCNSIYSIAWEYVQYDFGSQCSTEKVTTTKTTVSTSSNNTFETITQAGIYGYVWLILLVIIVVFLIFLLLLCCCCLKKYYKENDELKSKMGLGKNKEKWASTRTRENGVQVGSAKPIGVDAKTQLNDDSSIATLSVEDSDISSEGTITRGSSKTESTGTDHHIRHDQEDRESHSEVEAFPASQFSTMSNLPSDHPAKMMVPFDMLFVVDNSASIGLVNYKKVKVFLQDLIDNIDVAPGRSRIAVELFNVEPELYFSFDKYYSAAAVKLAVQKMPYGGGGTFLGRALQFASGILSQNVITVQNGDIHPTDPKPRNKQREKSSPPKRKRLQILCVISDGLSEDNTAQGTSLLHGKLDVKLCAVGVRSFHKERLKTVTQYDGSLFLLTDMEALSNWIFKQQSFHAENNYEFMDFHR